MATVPKSVVDRYYERRYVTDVGGRKGHHQYVHIHSNRLLVLGVTAEHVALKDMEEVVIDSKRKENQVKGKRKKGGVRLEPDTVLCRMKMKGDEDGLKGVPVRACLKGGNLIEMNMRLTENPSLLKEDPEDTGYVAIVMQRIDAGDAVLKQTISEEEYRAFLKKEEGQSEGEIRKDEETQEKEDAKVEEPAEKKRKVE